MRVPHAHGFAHEHDSLFRRRAARVQVAELELCGADVREEKRLMQPRGTPLTDQS